MARKRTDWKKRAKSEKEKARKHVRTRPVDTKKPLTRMQSAFAKAYMESQSLKEAALLAGYSNLNPSQSGAQALKQIRKATPEAMDEIGLTVGVLIKRHLVPLLNANETKFAQHEGEFTDHVDVAALATRTANLRMAFELQNAFPHEQSEIERRGGIDVLVIDIPRPKWNREPVDVPARPMPPRLKEPPKDQNSE